MTDPLELWIEYLIGESWEPDLSRALEFFPFLTLAGLSARLFVSPPVLPYRKVAHHHLHQTTQLSREAPPPPQLTDRPTCQESTVAQQQQTSSSGSEGISRVNFTRLSFFRSTTQTPTPITTMSSALARPLLRRPLPLRSAIARRFESSTAQKTAETAKNTAAEYKTKAAEGLSRVTSAAGPAIAGAAKGMSSALGRVGGRTGRVIGFVERT